jgi:hypothetical protein
MDTNIVLVYCLCDDLLKWQHPCNDPSVKRVTQRGQQLTQIKLSEGEQQELESVTRRHRSAQPTGVACAYCAPGE